MTAPSLRPAIFVLLALGFSAPTLIAVASGATTAVSAGEHLVGAVLVSWVAVSVIGHLVDGYRASAARRHHSHHSQSPGAHP